MSDGTNRVIESLCTSIYNSADGILKKAIGKKYRFRKHQRKLSEGIAKCGIREHAVVEAPTGAGKTLGNLIGAIIGTIVKTPDNVKCNPLVIYVTANKLLQDQLEKKDLPMLVEIFNDPSYERYSRKTAKDLTYVVLKGVSNYMCKAAVDEAEGSGVVVEKVWDEKGELPDGIDEDLRKIITVSHDSCPGSKCEFRASCVYYAQRLKAYTSNVIVMNYHIFFSLLFFTGFFEEFNAGGRVVNSIIFDEAHNMPHILRDFTGKVVNIATVQRLKKLFPAVGGLFDRFAILLGAFDIQEKKNRRFMTLEPDDVQNLLEECGDLLGELSDLAKNQRELIDVLHGKGKREEKVKLGRLQTFTRFWKILDDYLNSYGEDNVTGFAYSKGEGDLNFCFIILKDTFATIFSKFPQATFVHSSATLSVGGSLDFYINQIGGSDIRVHKGIMPPVFNYKKQCLAYILNANPKNYDEHIEAILEFITELELRFGGKMLVLCTSISRMKLYHDRISRVITGGEERCILQGTVAKNDVLEMLRDKDNDKIVFATRSFFEGIDVPGVGLSCVVLDKLPFLTPDDPVVKGYDLLIGNAFMEYSLPEMILTARQALGRLIRHEDDKGLVALCDSRVLTARYGKTFQRSLDLEFFVVDEDTLDDELNMFFEPELSV